MIDQITIHNMLFKYAILTLSTPEASTKTAKLVK